jgi:hypothetical protein
MTHYKSEVPEHRKCLAALEDDVDTVIKQRKKGVMDKCMEYLASN